MTAGARLPIEVIEHILSWVDRRRDLINFARASRACKALVIPRHAEYRVLRITDNADCIPTWEHLASRPDLASNFRVLHLLRAENAITWDGPRTPRTLLGPDSVPTKLPTVWSSEVVDEFYKRLCDVVERMDKLHTFVWEELCDGMVFEEHDEVVLGLVVKKLTLKNLLLIHKGGAVERLLILLQDRKNPVWGMANLEALVVDYDRGLNDHPFHDLIVPDTNFGPWVQSLSSSLTLLSTTPTAFAAHCSNLCLPALRRLSVYEGTEDDAYITAKIEVFLETHPCIEELSWTPLKRVVLAANCLPSLRKLACSSEFLLALEAATPPEIQRSSSRKIEELGINWGGGWNATAINLKDLVSLRCLDSSYVKRLRIERLAADSVKDLVSLPQSFPNVWHLYLPSYFKTLKKDSWLSQREWGQLLSRFPDLEVFLGLNLISSRDSGEESEAYVEEAVQRFGRWCSKLRQIAHYVEPEDDDECMKDVVRKVLIIREGPDPEARRLAIWLGKDEQLKNWKKIRWEYAESAPRDPFQTMPRSDDGRNSA
ncbi:hypothetical protein BDN72DRAFT_961577 [Pluteus cervinus]|uniref:Uncharacterized protein n=1 Tax=Pluteus cervinus TaxID=181527 RepID=A0ACD3AL89_9AGAR|nr:hypothetical protein BDN72DRAFT_961577 [Pluteus cervinus]